MARCQMYIGKIVSHPCSARSSERCAECDKKLCARHYDATLGLCVQCAGTYTPPQAAVVLDTHELDGFDHDDYAAFDDDSAAAGAAIATLATYDS